MHNLITPNVSEYLTLVFLKWFETAFFKTIIKEENKKQSQTQTKMKDLKN